MVDWEEPGRLARQATGHDKDKQIGGNEFLQVRQHKDEEGKVTYT